jgi:UDP-2-acetamido-3-amino-2,3-dideoxy-glucuronate N-acetyltransferase
MPTSYWAHPTAVLDEPVDIGPDTRIWHFCHVMTGAHVGPGCTLGQNVFVGGRAIVGRGCRVQNNVSIYDGVVLEDEVFVGPSAVFTNVKNPRAFIDRKQEYRETRIRRGASIGANATIVCGIQIGQYAFVAAGAVVTKDVPEHALVMGVPARIAGWVCRCGVSLVEGQQGLACPACRLEYERRGPGLAVRPERP